MQSEDPTRVMIENQTLMLHGEVKVYYCYTDAMLWESIESGLQEVDLISKRKIMNYSRNIDKVNSLMGRLMLKQALLDAGLTADLRQFRYDKSGKPLYPDVHFSLTHTEDMVLLAFSTEVEVGIDCEKNKFLDIDLFRDYFCDEEWSLIRNNGARELLRIWTRKEAMLKALGSGLIDKLSLINCLSDEQIYQENTLTFKELELDPAYLICLCSKI